MKSKERVPVLYGGGVAMRDDLLAVVGVGDMGCQAVEYMKRQSYDCNPVSLVCAPYFRHRKSTLVKVI